MKRIRLTAREIEAIVCIAGDVDHWATIESCWPEEEQAGVAQSFETGMNKLRAMLARRERARHDEAE